ncbi:hypothetical protein PCE1_000279 [Barthelona sp. PCE]
MEAHVVALLEETFTENVQVAAQSLKELREEEDFIPALLQIISGEYDVDIRKQASVQLKNFILHSWDGASAEMISDENREFVLENIVGCFINTPHSVRKILRKPIERIAQISFPTDWYPMEPILEGFSSGDIDIISGCAYCIRVFFKVFEWRHGARKAIISEKVLPDTFDHIIGISQSIVEMFEDEEMDCESEMFFIMHQLVKSLYSLNRTIVLPFFYESDNMTNLFSVLGEVLTANVAQPTKKHARLEKVPGFDMKKWALRLVARFSFFFAADQKFENEDAIYAHDHFLENFMGPSLELAIGLLKLSLPYYTGDDSFIMNEKIIGIAIRILQNATGPSSTWQFIIPHLEDIVNEGLIPIFSWNQKKQELYEEEPTALMNSTESFLRNYEDPVTNCIAFSYHMAKTRTSRVIPLFFSEVFDVGFSEEVCTSAESAAMKYGAIQLITSIAQLINGGNIDFNVRDSFIQYVLSEADNNDYPYLKISVCEYIQNFVGNDMWDDDDELVAHATNTIIEFLDVENDAVIAYTSIGIRTLMGFEAGLAAVGERLQYVLDRLFSLTMETRMTETVGLLGLVIQKFPEECSIHAFDMMRGLVEHWIDFFPENTTKLSTSEVDEFITLAMTSLNTMNQLLYAIPEDSVIFENEEFIELIMSVLQNCFDCGLIYSEFMEPASIMLCSLTYSCPKPLPECIWDRVPDLLEILEASPVDHFKAFMPCLDNLVANGAEVWRESPEYTEKVIEISLNLIKCPEYDFSDVIGASQAIENMFFYMIEHMDEDVFTQIALALCGRLTNTFFNDEGEPIIVCTEDEYEELDEEEREEAQIMYYSQTLIMCVFAAIHIGLVQNPSEFVNCMIKNECFEDYLGALVNDFVKMPHRFHDLRAFVYAWGTLLCDEDVVDMLPTEIITPIVSMLLEHTHTFLLCQHDNNIDPFTLLLDSTNKTHKQERAVKTQAMIQTTSGNSEDFDVDDDEDVDNTLTQVAMRYFTTKTSVSAVLFDLRQLEDDEIETPIDEIHPLAVLHNLYESWGEFETVVGSLDDEMVNIWNTLKEAEIPELDEDEED